jgi:hypothetical protein
MKWLIAVVLFVGCIWGGYEIWSYWGTFAVKDAGPTPPPAAIVDVNAGNSLPGLPADLQQSLTTAQALGPKALGKWIAKHKAKIKDPRLGWIQLDYVVLISPEDLYEARHTFKEVKERTETISPVYPRLKQLEASYGTPAAKP